MQGQNHVPKDSGGLCPQSPRAERRLSRVQLVRACPMQEQRVERRQSEMRLHRDDAPAVVGVPAQSQQTVGDPPASAVELDIGQATIRTAATPWRRATEPCRAVRPHPRRVAIEQAQRKARSIVHSMAVHMPTNTLLRRLVPYLLPAHCRMLPSVRPPSAARKLRSSDAEHGPQDEQAARPRAARSSIEPCPPARSLHAGKKGIVDMPFFRAFGSGRLFIPERPCRPSGSQSWARISLPLATEQGQVLVHQDGGVVGQLNALHGGLDDLRRRSSGRSRPAADRVARRC